jgi:hypothetical protein
MSVTPHASQMRVLVGKLIMRASPVAEFPS